MVRSMQPPKPPRSIARPRPNCVSSDGGEGAVGGGEVSGDAVGGVTTGGVSGDGGGGEGSEISGIEGGGGESGGGGVGGGGEGGGGATTSGTAMPDATVGAVVPCTETPSEAVREEAGAATSV